MSPWLAGILGFLLACVGIGSFCGYLFAVATATKERTLALAAAMLRGMTHGVESLCLTFEVNGSSVLLPIGEVATAIERCQFVAPPAPPAAIEPPPLPSEVRH